MSADLINIIFGMKVRQARLEANLTLSELAAKAEMSPSYLTEIEKGRKYPRANKIVKMAGVLGKSYDDLVSIQLAPSLGHLQEALSSPLLQTFPFEEFGLELSDLVTLLTRAPTQMSALLHAMGEIGRLYDMKEEHLLRAILRSYQELNDNYFPEMETAAQTLAETYGLNETLPVPLARMRAILEDEYGYTIQHNLKAQDGALGHYRAVMVDGEQPHLILNEDLLPRQVKFLLGREIGHQFRKVTERSYLSPPDRVNSFQQVFNDSQASYLAGALMMPRTEMVADLQRFFDAKTWQPNMVSDMLDKYDVTPEMLLYRFSELIPEFFGLQLHFLRMQFGPTGKYRLIKQLNMNRLLLPSGAGMHEHHCRRWLTVGLLQPEVIAQAEANRPVVGVQLSEFIESGERFLCVGFSRPLVLSPGQHSSVIVGFRVDDELGRTIRWADDPAVPFQMIHETCERCPLSPLECELRAVPPTIRLAQDVADTRKRAVQTLTQLVKS